MSDTYEEYNVQLDYIVVTNKTPAVKVELEVTPPANADSQFFRVEFGD